LAIVLAALLAVLGLGLMDVRMSWLWNCGDDNIPPHRLVWKSSAEKESEGGLETRLF
jgi:hypothetical protein